MSELIKQLENISVEKRELILKKLRKQKLISDSEHSKLPTPAIERISRKQAVPLSFAQQRLWFLDQLENESNTYNIPLAVKIIGLLDVEVLEKAITEIIQRHEVLRTTFPTVDGSPIQAIAPTLDLTLMVIDLQSLPEVDQLSEVQRLATEEAHLPFDLAKGPLLRGILLKLSESEYVLVFTVHHIVFDGWSMGILIRELTILYKSFSTGNPSPLPELTIQYADFAHWQRQWLCGKVLEDQLSYWRQQLSGDISVLQLPTDKARSLVQTFQEASQSIVLSKTLTKAIKTITEQSGATLFMTLLAAFQTLLYRYTGQEAISVGSPIANRNRTEIEGLIGFFANTLVLRTHLSGDLSFLELLRQVQEVALGAYANQDLPFEQIIAELNPDRKLSRTPLFQVMFVFQNMPLETLVLPRLVLSPLEVSNKTAKFDLTLSIEKIEEEIIGVFKYNSDLFDTSTISRMVGHFQTLLEGIIANPQQKISKLPLLTESERHQLLVEWNDTQTDYPQDKCIHQLFEDQVEKTPDAIAVVFEDQQLTYRELNNRANQLAHYLQTLGVKSETLVGICIDRSLEMVLGLLGILKADGAYVPLDTDSPADRFTYMLTNSQVSVLLTSEKLVNKLPENQACIVCLDADWGKISQENQNNCVSMVLPDNLAYVIYTSGSTGKPKGVMNTHRGVCNRLLWMQNAYGLNESDHLLQKTPFSFDVSVWEIFCTLLTGARLVVPKSGGHRDSNYLVNIIAKEQITTIHFVPSMLQIFLEETRLDSCNTLKRVICSGEALSYNLQERFFEHLGCELYNLYGPTEAGIDVTFWQCKPQTALDIVPIGRPIANTTIYILDSYSQPVPIGIFGELHIGDIQVARGYFNRPDLTAEKFIYDPFSNKPDARLYKTGDLARYLPDGNIEFLGRLDYQVKIRGFRIELGEIESVLAQHPSVQQVVVTVREDSTYEKYLVAYIVPNQEPFDLINEIRLYLKAKLPDYMIPSAFMLLKSMPLTPNGKIDRYALPVEGIYEKALGKNFVAPRNSTEKVLASIWTEVLRIEQVGVYDNFFEIGGHSLLLIQLIYQIHKTFSVDLPIHYLYESPTIASISQIIDNNQDVKNFAPTTINIDLYAETSLNFTISPDAVPINSEVETRSILLTGVTGFLGTYLLYELLQQTLADIYCLIRSSSVEEAKKNIKEKLESCYLWDEKFSFRIIPIVGDLSKPLLGLSVQKFYDLATQLDVIYHNGAWVNFTYPYSILKPTNVLGTQEILKLASQVKIKPVHFISTRSVFSSPVYSNKVIKESNPCDHSMDIYGGYAQSKWVSEKMVVNMREQGLPASIYRPGRITGHSQTGICNTNDLIWRMIKGCIQMGSIPELDIMIDMSPVDYISKAIIFLSRHQESLNKNFHLMNSNLIHWNDIIAWIQSFSSQTERLPYKQWQTNLIRHLEVNPSNALAPFLDIFPNEKVSLDEMILDGQNTLDGLNGSGLSCPAISRKILDTYLSYFMKSGFLINSQI